MGSLKRTAAFQPDTSLILLLKEGDHKAYERLYSLYCKKLYSFAFSYFKSRELSEEIVHDVFVKIWEKKAFLNESLSFNSYIFTITRNLIIDTIRKYTNEQLYKKELHYLQEISHNATESNIIYSNLEELTKEAVENLPEKRKAIFNLSRQQHMSYPEIARHLGVSQKTVETQMSRAIKYIKEYLYKHADIATTISWFIWMDIRN